MIPSSEDFVKLFQELGYFLGLRKEKPRWDRFNWREKFDYWAIFWGMPVMAGSGFILMYPVLVTKFLPGWVVPTALVAHSDEAMLALIWIFLVHTFFNHFTPGVFPINTSMFTGKVPKERYRREHPLEYERLFETAEEKE
jgi:cytochrome b subunit of formate dehydrogenase